MGIPREDPNLEKKPDRVDLGVETREDEAWECKLGAREEVTELEGVAK